MKIIMTHNMESILSNGKFVKPSKYHAGICPHCKIESEEYWDCWEGNDIEYDDFGLRCCQECMDANPEWKRTWDSLPSY